MNDKNSELEQEGSTEKKLQLIETPPEKAISWGDLKEERIGGTVLAVEPYLATTVTILKGEVPDFPEEENASHKSRTSYKSRKGDCCEGVEIKPECRIVNLSLANNFRDLKISLWGKHECGLQSIAAFVAQVTYQPTPTGRDRILTPIRVNGQMLGGFVRYNDCPSAEKERHATLTVSTNAIIGTVFAVQIAVKSCCNVSNVHGQDDPCVKVSSDRLII